MAVTLPSLTGALQATASLSADGQQAYVILGGCSGSADVVIKGISSTSLGGQWEWTGGNNQLWKITQVGGSYEFANKVSGKALDVYDASASDGGTIDQWTYSGSSNQLWSITAR